MIIYTDDHLSIPANYETALILIDLLKNLEVIFIFDLLVSYCSKSK